MILVARFLSTNYKFVMCVASIYQAILVLAPRSAIHFTALFLMSCMSFLTVLALRSEANPLSPLRTSKCVQDCYDKFTLPSVRVYAQQSFYDKFIFDKSNLFICS